MFWEQIMGSQYPQLALLCLTFRWMQIHISSSYYHPKWTNQLNLDHRLEWLCRLDCCCRYCLNYHWWYDVAFNCFYCKIELQGLDELPVLIQILLKTYFFLPPLVRKPLPLLIFAQTTDGDGWIGVTASNGTTPMRGFGGEGL